MATTLAQLLNPKREMIYKQWSERFAASYPPDTARFLLNQADPFANPVGHTAAQALKGLLAWLLDAPAAPPEQAGALLDPLIRVRAVQTSLSPSQATGFIFALKEIVRQALGEAACIGPLRPEALHLEARIEALGLQAFDRFVACRETVYEIKANEVRRSVYRAFQRAKLLVEVPEGPAEAGDA
jgi:hypothetical protein